MNCKSFSRGALFCVVTLSKTSLQSRWVLISRRMFSLFISLNLAASPLTNHDQACLAQQFCSYFYHRYCTPLGDVKRARSNRDSPANIDQLTSEDCSRPKITSLDRAENYGESEVQPSQQRALCPFFYTGSLSEAIQLSERPSGRPVSYPRIEYSFTKPNSPMPSSIFHFAWLNDIVPI